MRFLKCSKLHLPVIAEIFPPDLNTPPPVESAQHYYASPRTIVQKASPNKMKQSIKKFSDLLEVLQNKYQRSNE
jgi:hypothetical protein